MKLTSLDSNKNFILKKIEEVWRLKSRALWIEGGNENTKYFHHYANFRKSNNSIWELQAMDGRSVRGFKDLFTMGLTLFKDIYKER